MSRSIKDLSINNGLFRFSVLVMGLGLNHSLMACEISNAFSTTNNGCVISDGDTITIHEGVVATLSGVNALSDDFKADVQIINKGSVETDAWGIFFSGENHTLVNDGLLSGDSVGVFSFGVGADLTNNGKIVSSGAAIQSIGNNASITNTGYLQGGFAGIFTFGGDLQINNSGDIQVDGNGISVENSNITVHNSGTITSTGGDGFSSLASNVVMTNSGVIRAGDEGIVVNGPQTAIYNKGVIEAGFMGVYFGGGGDQYLENRGSISAGLVGANSAAVSMGAGASFDNYGYVSAPNIAINAQGSGNTSVRLLGQSFIVGKMQLDEETDVTVNLDPSHSVHWTFDDEGHNLANFTVSGKNVFVDRANHVVSSYDVSGLAGQFNQLVETTRALSNLDRRDANEGLWVGYFRSDTEFESQGNALEQSVDITGYALGYGWAQSDKLHLGLKVGELNSDVVSEKSTYASTSKSNNDGLFAAINGSYQLENQIRLAFSLSFGEWSNDQVRLVNDNLAENGLAYADSSVDSWFISPEFQLSKAFEIGRDGETVTPYALLRYSEQHFDSFNEGVGHASVSSFKLAATTADVGVEFNKRTPLGSIGVRGGHIENISVGDESTDAEIGSATGTLTFDDLDSSSSYVGLSADVGFGEYVKLELSGEYLFGGEISSTSGQVKLLVAY